MENVLEKSNDSCTGCGVCAIACAIGCINIELNEFGFYNPVIDESECLECGDCIAVCYKFKNSDKDADLKNCKKVLAAIDKDKEELLTVSSGGVGNRIAKYYNSINWKICGAIYDYQKEICVHKIAEDDKDIELFKTSKYIQSYTYGAFSKIDEAERYVIFGTPCQIFALRKFIIQRKIENQFILVDFFCRGVPTLLLWDKYLKHIKNKYAIEEIININFRNKNEGWHKFSMYIQSNKNERYIDNVYNDLFWSFYLKNICLNRVCYECPFRHHEIYSDIRIGDFWGKKYYSNDTGVSLVVINTDIGDSAWSNIDRLFDSEENEKNIIFESQRFDKYPINSDYTKINDMLKSERDLVELYNDMELAKMSFYKGK